MHTVKVTVTIDSELEYEYERALETEDRTRKLVGDVQLAVLNTDEDLET